MAATTKKTLKHGEYTVAIICPLEVEMSAVRYMLDDEHARLPSKAGDSNRYIFGEMSGHNVVIGFLPEGSQGIGTAATVATDMRRTFPTCRLRLLVGIGGGVPSHTNDVRLGDVVVGMPSGTHGGVVQYDLVKETITGFEQKGSLDAPPKSWRDAVVEMKSDHRVKKNRISEFLSEMVHRYPQLSTYRPPASEKDILFLPDNVHVSGQMTCKECDKGRVVERTTRHSDSPTIFYGLIASGNRVMENAKTRDRVSNDAGGVLCFEMEAAGLVNDFQCIVVRGIADYADSHKNDDWRAYGAAVAAGCAKELLTYMVPVIETRPAQYSTIPYQRVKDFIGRDEQLTQIASYFSSPNVNRPRILILHAMGGQGKSQIALEYCRQTNTVYRGLFWVNARSESTAVQSYVTIAQVLDASAAASLNDTEKVNFVLRALAHWEERWLVVFDNYDDPTVFPFPQILTFLPTGGQGDILFTSRHRGLERLGKVLDVPPLPSKDGVNLLLRDFKGVNLENYMSEASRIVDRLGGLALAIDQAAAYIQYRQLAIDHLDEFLKTYEKEQEKVLQYTPEDIWEYGAMRMEKGAQEKAGSAFTTWDMSLRQLSQGEAERSAAVAHFFALSAFLAPATVSESIFHPQNRSFKEITQAVGRPHINSTWDHDHFWGLIFRANRLSLVQSISHGSEPDGATFSLHPLIRDWLQLREKRRQRRGFTSESIEMVVSSIRVFKNRGTAARIKKSLLLHMDTCLRNDIEFSKVGHRLGEEMNNCDAANCFAEFYYEQGRYESTFLLESMVQKTMMKIHGKEHPDTLTCMSNLALVLSHQGKYDEAEQMHRDVLGIRQKYDEAEQMHRDVLGITQKVLGMEHPDTLASMNNLAAVLSHQGKYDEAERILRDVLEITQKVLGMEHPSTLTNMNNLAAVLSDRGKYDEAEQMHRGVSEIRQKVLGMEHPSTIASMINLATVLSHQGNYDDAERILRDVLGITQKVLGMEHPSTLTSMNNLAAVLSDQGKYDEAEQMHRGVSEITQKHGPYKRKVELWEAIKLIAECVQLRSRILDARACRLQLRWLSGKVCIDIQAYKF
ncbi:uncharacterized protein Z518_01394 [Rhinocladiella mackenziei CBS 650.93]|uniref:NB-ARC domain-containing protein n=1 Tax=Rhinocladiella mackenziei CBS 650.93 TaxID=1442369 RepID=A0A0D2G5V5_9EURO|nr:uncharacterized protein Z518_01394 [Rhinocladiella mackenziei CBS 650.93]KIX10312.1 hypothetical protein Z518_01394 [Rhinocladiella mackenziei CBS 650.93]